MKLRAHHAVLGGHVYPDATMYVIAAAHMAITIMPIEYAMARRGRNSTSPVPRAWWRGDGPLGGVWCSSAAMLNLGWVRTQRMGAT